MSSQESVQPVVFRWLERFLLIGSLVVFLGIEFWVHTGSDEDKPLVQRVRGPWATRKFYEQSLVLDELKELDTKAPALLEEAYKNSPLPALRDRP